MKSYKRYTVTAALPYTNGGIHIGHLAGVYIPSDIYARYLRAKGKDVAFICGSDEHGVPITIKAKNENITPQKVVDKYHKIIKTSFDNLGISFDNYSRTSNKIHHQTASDFFKKLNNHDKFITKISQQFYDEKENQFLADRYITGTCPKCSFDGAYGDQCEKCGSSLNATDLINPKSALSGNTPILKETKHWFLPLNNYQQWLEEWILKGKKNEWKPNVYGQVKSWLDDGLQPRAVTRDLDWGIKVPVKDAQGKVLYVWFDAPIGYISATKEWAEKNNKNWEDYWKNENTKLVHFIGKDNIVFHCIIFPCMLNAHGDYIFPENIPANEFLNLEGHKISTSRNWAVWLDEYLQDFENKQDVLRYVLTSNAPETKDNDFTWKDFQMKNNSELVGILGNFVNRVSVLIDKYYNGYIPVLDTLQDIDNEVLKQLKSYPQKISKNIESYKFRDAINELMNLARLGNKYLADEEPWKKMKTDEKRVQTIMNISAQIVAHLGVLMGPFMPFTSVKILKILNIDKNLNWENLEKEFILNENHKIKKSELLFEKIEDTEIKKQLDKLKQSKVQNKIEAVKDEISFEDFSKIDIRTGTILEAEKIKKTNKLLKLKVDVGTDIRTIVSGIAESFSTEEIIGKKVSVLVNLSPRRIRGIESNGMILMVENTYKKLEFVTYNKNNINNGSQIL